MLRIHRYKHLLSRAFTLYIFSTAFVYSIAAAHDSNSAAARTDSKSIVSKRIEVYSLSQNYWDTKYGDTLSEIVQYLLPNNPAKHATLQKDIVRLNPHAFINANAAQLVANKRLWLPGYVKQADTQPDPETTIVESYSWGNIKRPLN